jgi:hypothetical protein
MEVDLGNGFAINLVEEQPEDAFAPIFSDAWTGSRVWAAAHVLVDHLRESSHAGALAGARMIELGAGPGLCGLAAAGLGAASVLITDQEEMVELMRRNIALNPELLCVSAAELRWGSELPASTVQPPYDIILVSVRAVRAVALYRQLLRPALARRSHWRFARQPAVACLPAHVPSVFGHTALAPLASALRHCSQDCVNIIYGSESFAQLAATIRSLSSPQSRCLLSHEERSAASAFDAFRSLCAAQGLSVRELSRAAPTDADGAGVRVGQGESGAARAGTDGSPVVVEGGGGNGIQLFEIRLVG